MEDDIKKCLERPCESIQDVEDCQCNNDNEKHFDGQSVIGHNDLNVDTNSSNVQSGDYASNVESGDFASDIQSGDSDGGNIDGNNTLNMDTNSDVQSEICDSDNINGCGNRTDGDSGDLLDSSDDSTSDNDTDEEKEPTVDQQKMAFKNGLLELIVQGNVTHNTTNKLLNLLNQHHPDYCLPKDARTFLKGGNSTCIESFDGDNGKFCYFGIRNCLAKVFSVSSPENSSPVLLDINIDGLPLYRSSSVCFWPILGSISCLSEPFMIALYCGVSKPPIKEFLRKFIEEYIDLQRNGYKCGEHIYSVKIRAFICDAPARAFIKQCKGHVGYSGCGKCTTYGVYKDHTMSYPDTEAPLRTDEDFQNQKDTHHHIGISPLQGTGIGLVTSFPVEYMHLILLGVCKRLLNFWYNVVPYKLSSTSKMAINQSLINIRRKMPIEFARKPRSLAELSHWKASEFRTFLFFLSPIILKNHIPRKVYRHFMLFVCAMHI
jgi:hypothetical protein